MREKLRKKEKRRKDREEGMKRGGVLMGTAERGGGGIYQERRVIFNDPCMWRGKTEPARSPPPNTDPLT